MANAVVEHQQKRTRVLQHVLKENMTAIKSVIPSHVTPERMARIALGACRQTPKLLDCNPDSFMHAVITASILGLPPDGVLGQGYLVPFKDQVQFIPGYKGLISLARRSGELSAIGARVVRANDEFRFEFGVGEDKFKHVPMRASAEERGDVTDAYCVARFKDGGAHLEVMNVHEINDIRDGSQGWQFALRSKSTKRDKDGNLTYVNSPWWTHYDQMASKTVIRRASKFLPLSVEDQRAFALLDHVDAGKVTQINQGGDFDIEGEFTEANDPQIEDQSDDAGPKEEKRAAIDRLGDNIDPETGEVATAKTSNKTAAKKDPPPKEESENPAAGAEGEPQPGPTGKITDAEMDAFGPNNSPFLFSLAELRLAKKPMENWMRSNGEKLEALMESDPAHYAAVQRALDEKRVAIQEAEAMAAENEE